ncbi:hypothetical protein BD410DRAFT_699758, partial [Rickenella mellea]
SKVYDHYIMPPTIGTVDGEIHYFFRCKDKPDVVLSRVRHEDSTSNLNKHARVCSPPAPSSQTKIRDFAHGTNYEKSKFRFLITIWVARRHRPYAIVEDPELIQLFQMLYLKVEIPSRMTVSRDVREVYEITKQSIVQMLAVRSCAYCGFLHLCIDGWTSPNVISFLGITVHRVTEGKM